MRKLLNRPWFVALLAISAVVLCTWSLRDQLGYGRPKTHPSAVAMAPDPVGAEDADPEAIPDADATVAGGPVTIPAALAALIFPPTIPDPFTRRGANMVAGDPEPEAVVKLPDDQDTIQLTGVWHQGSVRLALVNNHIVRSGDHVGRLTIEDISVDGLWVSHWKGRDFVAFGAAFTLLTPATGAPAPSLALHEH